MPELKEVWSRNFGGQSHYIKQGNTFEPGRKFYCWMNGCRIHPGFEKLDEAIEFSLKYVLADLCRRIEKSIRLQTVLLNGITTASRELRERTRCEKSTLRTRRIRRTAK